MLSAESLVFGSDETPRVVCIDADPAASERVTVYAREGDAVKSVARTFRPFLWARDEEVLAGAPAAARCRALEGDGALRVLASFDTWKQLGAVAAWLRRSTGEGASSPRAPYLVLNDPVQQFLVATGLTSFRDMTFPDVRRLQFDLETYTEPGYDFSNAGREGDRIIAIGLSDSTGWSEVLSGRDLGERELIETFVARVRERDPDVIEGHNLFGFDLPYLAERARRCKVRLRLGRDGSVPRARPSRFTAGERTVNYTRFELRGRSVVDTYFLVQIYDVSHRALPGLGLKEVARHFGVAAEDRTYLEGAEIARVFREDPASLEAYVRDDVIETRSIAALLEPTFFTQAQILPFSLQNVCVRGNAAKIDALMLRAYYAAGRAVPLPDTPRSFEGGYTDIFETGVIHDVHHGDVRSLYPSIMLSGRVGPRSDDLGAFLALLDYLRTYRLAAKERMRAARSEEARLHADALQSTFKVLINSFYGYLGFGMARFNDFDAAERVTAEGRRLLRSLIDTLRRLGARPIEIDTDGIYFVPPKEALEDPAPFRAKVAAGLPEGIEIEFDGEYVSMFSYKMKNYALLATDGEVLLTGAALKSRGLEPFLRDFAREAIEDLLREDGRGLADLAQRYRDGIAGRTWPIHRLAKTERLKDAPEAYRKRIAASARGRNAAYELALAAERPYAAGDSVSYYVTGEKKSVAVHANARMVADWDPERRDENVPFYLARLEEMVKKFEKFAGGGEHRGQGELELA